MAHPAGRRPARAEMKGPRKRMGSDPQGLTILQRRRGVLLEDFFVPADTARHIRPDAGRPKLTKIPCAAEREVV